MMCSSRLLALLVAVAPQVRLTCSFSPAVPRCRSPRGCRWGGETQQPRNQRRVRNGRHAICMTAEPADAHHVASDGVRAAVDEFISTVQSSLDDGSFESFALKGPSAPRKRRRKGGGGGVDDDATEQKKERLRGKYKTVSGRLVMLQEKKKRKKRAEKGSDDNNNETLYVQSTIKYHLATDLAKNWKVEKASNSKRTEVEEGLMQLFSTAMGEDSDGAGPISEWGADNLRDGELGILAGELCTSDGVYKLQLQPPHKASFRLSKKKKPSNKSTQGGIGDRGDLSHDRSKNVPLSPSSRFFQELGVANADGKPVAGMASKLRQCQKFVEIVGNLVDAGPMSSSASPPDKIRVVDMGCGRGYLTFSLHSYLSGKFGSACAVETRGVDRRPKLIEEINGIASSLGGEFDSLKFIEGTIGTHNGDSSDLRGSSDGSGSSLDILICLHACDTATDDALWDAICRDADIIVTAPCCQHELRPQIDRCASSDPDHPLGDILRHAIYRERATETVTDAMRALLLEIAGYDTQVFEFIGGEHTAKNCMIAATKVRKQRKGRDHESWMQDRRRRLVNLAQLYGIERQRLALLMGERIVPTSSDDESKPLVMNLSGMAPL